MGNYFIKYFFIFLVQLVTDSNWKPFIYHTFMIVAKRLGSNDNLNTKLRRIPKSRVFMLNVNLKNNEPSPGH